MWEPFFYISLGLIVGVVLQRNHLLGRAKRNVFNKLRWVRARRSGFSSHPFEIEVRSFSPPDDGRERTSEVDGSYEHRMIETTTAQIALILVDVWADHPIKGWQTRANANITEQIAPLVAACREHQILVVHAAHGEGEHPLVRPAAGDLVIEGPTEQSELTRVLKNRGIQYLFYSGYASNMCILGRPTGIFEMQKLGYDIVFVRDASLAIEAPEFLDQEMTHQVATYMIEANWGSSTNVGNVLAALDSVE